MAQIINYAMDSNETSNSGKNLSWKQGKQLGEVEFVVDGNVTKAYSYEYDPYGNIVSINTYNDDTFGNINPIRYKAYYYDTDLGWYNLGSRYYDPSVGRFINCDSIGIINNNASDIENKNLYTYCNNNPVMYYDDGGDIPVIVVVFLLGGCSCGLIDSTSAAIEENEYSPLDSLNSFVTGGIGATSGVGALCKLGLDTYNEAFIKNQTYNSTLRNAAMNNIPIGVGSELIDPRVMTKTIDLAVNHGTQIFLDVSYGISYNMVVNSFFKVRNKYIKEKKRRYKYGIFKSYKKQRISKLGHRIKIRKKVRR